jgi:hypothetical protein
MLIRNILWLLIFAGLALLATGGSFSCEYTNGPTTLQVNNP